MEIKTSFLLKILVLSLTLLTVLFERHLAFGQTSEDQQCDSNDETSESCRDTSSDGKSKYVDQNSDDQEDEEESQLYNDYVNVMITFYNAKSNNGLQEKFGTTVGSILQHTSVPIKFHLIGEEESQKIGKDIIAKLANGKNFSTVDLDLEELASEVEDRIKPMQKHFSYKPGSYYNHALFFLSIVLHEVMPDTMKQVIMLDADLKFKADIKLLHDKFRFFTKANIIGIGREGQPVYRHTFSKFRQENPTTRVGEPPPNGLTGFNSGVLLLDLEKMRHSKLYNQLLTAENIGKLTSEFHFKGHLGDQDFYTLISLKYEWLFYVLPCQWNRQLCQWWRDHGYAKVFDQYFSCEKPIHIYHGNCNTPIPQD